MKRPTWILFLCLLGLSRSGLSQQTAEVETRLEAAMAELDAARTSIKGESVALTRELTRLQRERVEARETFDEVRGTLDRRSLEINNLNRRLESSGKSRDYLSGLFDDYLRNWESRLHVSEVARYGEAIAEARAAAENPNLGPGEKFDRQIGALELSLKRMEDLVGGSRFSGRAAGPDGRVREGTFLLAGPLAVFASDDGALAGEAELIPNQNEPAVLDFGDPAWIDTVKTLVKENRGELPFDPSLGNARKMAATEETMVEHILAGGIVMWPILVMFAIAILIILYKWMAFVVAAKPSPKEIALLYALLGRGDKDGARRLGNAMKGNLGIMFRAGTDHLEDPKDMIEEVMYEKMLDIRFKLYRLLPFIAVCAASAPLLGLLGTVTGIINTFKLLTVFGSGDVKALSSGISEALITTEYGLIVAIPSLLAHAFLTRTAKSKMDRMEQGAILFLSALEKGRTGGKAQPPSGGPDVSDPGSAALLTGEAVSA
jgi:biopolymer transport protein ExbB